MNTTQQSYLAKIRHRILRTGAFPTIRDLKQDLGLSSTGSIHKQLMTLAEAGYIDHLPNRGFAANERTMGDAYRIPVLGKVAAGQPIEAITQDECINMMALLGEGRFSLIASGDSMIGAGIMDGDYLVFDNHYAAGQGDVVAALIRGHETTVKTFQRKGNRVVLHPENADYPDQIYAAHEVEIQGIMIANIRLTR